VKAFKIIGGEDMPDHDIKPYVSEYGLRLTNLCLKLSGSKSDAEDLYQETWYRIFNNFHMYDKSRPFDKWSYSVCVNTFRNIYKKQKRTPIIYNDDALLRDSKADVSALDIEQLELREAVDALDEKYRLVVVLYYFEDLALAEVASILEISVGTAKSRLFKARELLKRRITEHE